jgi:hypothetical protein
MILRVKARGCRLLATLDRRNDPRNNKNVHESARFRAGSCGFVDHLPRGGLLSSICAI